MKKLLTVLVCLGMLMSFLPSCFADAADSFTFRDGITWGMSEEEVMGCEKGQSSLFNRTDDGALSILQYEGVQVSTLKNSTLTYIFRDGALSSAIYMLNDADEATANYIIEAMASKYGEEEALGYKQYIKIRTYLSELSDAFGNSDTEEGSEPPTIKEKLGLPEETLIYQVLSGASWELPDGTQIICTVQPLTQTPMLLYLCPENESEYDTGGL